MWLKNGIKTKHGDKPYHRNENMKLYCCLLLFCIYTALVSGQRWGLCSQPINPGTSCVAGGRFVQRWANFNNRCVPFWYYGCGGNDNNFA